MHISHIIIVFSADIVCIVIDHNVFLIFLSAVKYLFCGDFYKPIYNLFYYKMSLMSSNMPLIMLNSVH